jgi:hypothetical protein
MSSLIAIARLIPAEERRIVLEHDFIAKSKAYYQDYAMRYLLMLWKAYVEPHIDTTCPACIGRIRNNWVGMQQTLIDLEQQSRELDVAK